MTKNKLIGLIVLIVIALTGCDKWLEVEPKNQVTDGKLFSDYSGYRNALNGIYEKLSSQKLYGRELTWGFLSVLSQTYEDSKIESSYPRLCQYDYGQEDTREIISDIWTESYNAIANCNKLLDEIEKETPSFFPLGEGEKNLIQGEALALRAFIHLDLLRLFAPAPILNKGDRYIPYFEKYPSKFEAKETTADFMERVITDLNRAKDLVTSYDTAYNVWYVSSPESRLQIYNEPEGGRFFSFRGGRMNYIAIHGLLARAYLYAGDKENAEREARFILKNFVASEGGKDMIKFTNKANVSGANKGFYTKYWEDILLAFYDDKLTDEIDNYKLGTDGQLVLKDWSAMFTGRGDGNDYRAKQEYLDSESGQRFTKKWMNFKGESPMVTAQYPLIPILRLSEVYYILSECLSETRPDEAKVFFEKLREARGCFRAIDMRNFTDELVWEGKKEFLTEGQIFFLFKRLNRPVVSGNQSITLGDKFVLPIPESEDVH